MMASVPPKHLEAHWAPPSANRLAPGPGLCQAGRQRQSGEGHRVPALKGRLESAPSSFLSVKTGRLPWLVGFSGGPAWELKGHQFNP